MYNTPGMPDRGVAPRGTVIPDQAGGVCSHSVDMAARSMMIITTDPDRVDSLAMSMREQGIWHKEVQGCYTYDDGSVVDERSFLILQADFYLLQNSMRLWFKNQESYLHLGICNARGERRAIIEKRAGGELEYIGWFRSVPKDRALASKAYTESGGVFYTCELGDSQARS